MKAGLLCLAALAAAQPRQHRRHHHQRREVVTDIVTDVAYATAANVIVYVDGNGNPISTGAQEQPQPTQYSAPPPAPYSQAPPPPYSQAPPPPHSQAPPAPSVAPTTLVPKPSSSAAAPSSQPSAPASGGDASGYGLSYSPYHADNTCKTQDEVNADFNTIFSNGAYGIVRLYGTDCNQVSMVLKATQDKGTKIFAGIFDIDQVEKEAQILVSAVNGDWSRIDTVSVGNELVNGNVKTPAQVKAAVEQARGCLTGYNGPVVTVDTFVAIKNNKDTMCDIGDYIAANCHAFFDGGVTADQAGDFVVKQAQEVSATCGGKKTVITESGWPSQGQSNKAAVPSVENQKAAVASLKQSFSSNLFLFTAFNDHWKTSNAAQFNAEQYWGIMGDSASCKA